MSIDDLRALIDNAEGAGQVYVLLDGHRDVAAEIDSAGDLIVTPLFRP